MLSIQHVSFSYETANHFTPVFRNVSFQLPTKGLYIVKGENGIGKSTLFKLITRSIKPQIGTITFCHQSDFAYAWMEQHVEFFDHLTLKHYWQCFKQFIHPHQWNHKLEKELIESLKMGNLFQSKVGVLSGGERQRLHLMMTLLTPASLYLIDEPTASVDESLKTILAHWIKQHAKDALVLVITHEPTLFEKMADGDVQLSKKDVVLHLHTKELSYRPCVPIKSRAPKLQSVGHLLKQPKVPNWINPIVPMIGIFFLTLITWMHVAIDETVFHLISPSTHSIFSQIEIRESEAIEGSPFEWVKYRSLNPSEQQSVLTYFENTFFIPDYRHLVFSTREIEGKIWQFLPYDDLAIIDPKVYVTESFPHAQIALTDHLSEKNEVEVLIQIQQTMNLLPSFPTFYYPYFWLKNQLSQQGFLVFETSYFWWYIPQDHWQLSTLKRMHDIQDQTALVFHHRDFMAFHLYTQSKPFLMYLLSIFGLVYGVGWLIVDGFVFERRMAINHGVSQWIKKRPLGKRILHQTWLNVIRDDCVYLFFITPSIFWLLHFTLHQFSFRWMVTIEPLLLVFFLMVYGVYRWSLYDILRFRMHDSHR